MSAVWIKTAGQIILPLLIEMSGNEEKNLLSFFMYVFVETEPVEAV